MYNDILNQVPKISQTFITNQKSEFKFEIELSAPTYVIVAGDFNKAKIFLQPGNNLNIEIYSPKNDLPKSFLNPQFTYCDFSSDTTNINYKIQKIDACIDTFTNNHFELFLRPQLLQPFVPILDSSIKASLHLKDPFAMNYLKYSMAKLYDASTIKKKTIIETYFSTAISFENYEYFNFFTYHFNGYLQALSTKTGGEEIENDINKKHDWQSLISHIKQADASLKNDTLCQLISLIGLRTWYNTRGNSKKSVEYMLRSAPLLINHPLILLASKNITNELLQFQEGLPAPKYTLQNSKNIEVNNESLKGKFTYISFYSSDSPEFTNEYPLFQKLQILYGNNVNFLFVSLDENQKDFSNFFNGAEIPSEFYFINRDREFLSKFGISSIPQFCLIDRDGDWKNYFAPTPSNGLEAYLKQIIK